MAKELDRIIQIDNEDFNIVAKSAGKVENKLTIKSTDMLLGVEDTSKTVVFDGSSPKDILIVPASGGKFAGKIRINSYNPKEEFEFGTFPADAVLNYSDIKTVLLNSLSNTSALYYWSVVGDTEGETPEGETPERSLIPNVIEGTVSGISIVMGPDGEVSNFAQKNYANGYLAAYLYISYSNILYYGTRVSSVATRIAANASDAVKLLNSHTITTSLDGTAPIDANGEALTANFDGTADVIAGVTGVLPPTHGGTGQTNLANVTVGKANKLTTAKKLYTNLGAASTTTTFDGSADTGIGVTGTLSVAHGGTGQTSLANVTVGNATTAVNANAVKTTFSATSDTSQYANIYISKNIPTASNGKVGDIWIKY